MQSGTKPHYPVLDGLRGVAALMVIAFHICEAHSTSHLDQVINHGYLAVDFFFLLSGFVVGYAYDDRWNEMSTGSFFRRRLIRLQPMVVIGMIIGAISFYLQDHILFPAETVVPVWKILMILVIGSFMLPVPPSLDIRGWHEMYPLNGPGWSLFFEYIANILYALFVRKFSKTALWILVVLSGIFLVHMAVAGKSGDVIGGWSLDPDQLHIGFARMLFPFFAGLLLSRIAKPTAIKNGFLWCSLLVIAVLAFPRVGGAERLWANGLYDSLSIIFIFPLIVYMGASAVIKSKTGARVCKFLGDISYPIYITHYPLIYLYTMWVYKNKIPMSKGLPVGALVFVASIAIAYACLKLYDEPVRKWLARRYSK